MYTLVKQWKGDVIHITEKLEEKPEQTRLNPPWREAFKVAQHWEYDSYYSRDAIAAIMGIDRIHQYLVYVENMEMLRKHMLSIGKRLKNIRGKGYKVLKPVDQLAEVGISDQVKLIRKRRMQGHAALAIPDDGLDDNEKRSKEAIVVDISRNLSRDMAVFKQNALLLKIEPQQKMLAKRANKKEE
jgi:hypothetical protein